MQELLGMVFTDQDGNIINDSPEDQDIHNSEITGVGHTYDSILSYRNYERISSFRTNNITGLGHISNNNNGNTTGVGKIHINEDRVGKRSVEDAEN